MDAHVRKAFRVGLVAIVGAVALSFIGCQPSDRMAVSPTNPMCPVCAQAAQARHLADLNVTQVVCPVCGDVEQVDPQFLERIEIFTGRVLADPVYACAMCSALIEQCAACPPAASSLARRNDRRWQ